MLKDDCVADRRDDAWTCDLAFRCGSAQSSGTDQLSSGPSTTLLGP